MLKCIVFFVFLRQVVCKTPTVLSQNFPVFVQAEREKNVTDRAEGVEKHKRFSIKNILTP